MKQVMTEMDSLEFSKWIAFERVYGPVGPTPGMWQADALAGIHEQLQLVAYLLSQAHFTSKHKKRGPIPQPTRYKRPHEPLFKQPLEDVSDYNSEEWQVPPEEEECPPNCVCKSGKQKQIDQVTVHESEEGQEEE